MGLRTRDIELAVATHFNFRKYLILPNISWGMGVHECDLMIVRRSGYAIEVEIKISLSDLKKDREKPHQHRSNKIKELYFAIPMSRYEKWAEYIPERAGIILVNEDTHRCKIVRNPETNKKAKPFGDAELAKFGRLGILRYWSMRFSSNRGRFYLVGKANTYGLNFTAVNKDTLRSVDDKQFFKEIDDSLKRNGFDTDESIVSASKKLVNLRQGITIGDDHFRIEER